MYALQPSVPKDTVGDIDVWVCSEGDFNKVLALVDVPQATCKVFEDYLPNLSVVSVIIQECTVQIIMTQEKSILQLIKSFDMSYVQCGIYDGKVYQTKLCKQALASHTVSHILDSRSNRVHRYKKAVSKGFSVPLTMNRANEWNHSGLTMVSMEMDLVVLSKKEYIDVYFSPESDTLCPYSFDVIDVEWKRLYHQRGVTMGNFILGSKEHSFQRRYVSSRVTVQMFEAFDSIKFEHSPYIGRLILSQAPPIFDQLDQVRVYKTAFTELPDSFTGECVICYKLYNFDNKSDTIRAGVVKLLPLTWGSVTYSPDFSLSWLNP